MRLRLFAFPYAGAGASVFSSWSRFLPADVELCGVQMPGREGRLGEPPITCWDDAIPRLAEGLMPAMDRPFAFFGHSLGAALAFELARHLRRDRLPGPVHLFVSGRKAPHLRREEPPTYNLPRAQFLHELTRWGTPDSVLNNPELLDVFLPLLRADFGLSEMHVCRPEAPLATPISAYGGEHDEHVLPAQVDGWREHTSAGFRRVLFPGGHFFLNEHRADLLSEFGRELQAITMRLTLAYQPSF
jgi:medium-chain acyl-[acyl-carrier-protein] hydrolase